MWFWETLVLVKLQPPLPKTTKCNSIQPGDDDPATLIRTNERRSLSDSPLSPCYDCNAAFLWINSVGQEFTFNCNFDSGSCGKLQLNVFPPFQFFQWLLYWLSKPWSLGIITKKQRSSLPTQSLTWKLLKDKPKATIHQARGHNAKATEISSFVLLTSELWLLS